MGASRHEHPRTGRDVQHRPYLVPQQRGTFRGEAVVFGISHEMHLGCIDTEMFQAHLIDGRYGTYLVDHVKDVFPEKACQPVLSEGARRNPPVHHGHPDAPFSAQANKIRPHFRFHGDKDIGFDTVHDTPDDQGDVKWIIKNGRGIRHHSAGHLLTGLRAGGQDDARIGQFLS